MILFLLYVLRVLILIVLMSFLNCVLCTAPQQPCPVPPRRQPLRRGLLQVGHVQLHLCTAPTTKGNAYTAATSWTIPNAAAVSDATNEVTTTTSGASTYIKSQVEKACTARRALRTTSLRLVHKYIMKTNTTNNNISPQFL